MTLEEKIKEIESFKNLTKSDLSTTYEFNPNGKVFKVDIIDENLEIAFTIFTGQSLCGAQLICNVEKDYQIGYNDLKLIIKIFELFDKEI